MPCQGCSGYGQQLGRAPLIPICLFINESDMASNSAGERKIKSRVLFTIIGKRDRRLLVFGCGAVWLQVGRKNDVLGHYHRTITEERHRSHRMIELTKISPPLVVKQ